MKSKNYLISYNHSGNTWVRYCIEYLTQKPTHGHRDFSISERNNNFLDVDLLSECVLLKRHTLDVNELKESDTIVLLLRHPSKCIKQGQDVAKESKKYFDLIEVYESFKGKKIVYYFDEIFEKEHINNLITFYGIPFNHLRLRRLFENWNHHKKESKSIYQNKTNGMGCDLSLIPNALLEHELIKKCKDI